MFNFVALTIILLVQILPSLFGDRLYIDIEYEVYATSNLLIIAFLSILVCKEQFVNCKGLNFKSVYNKIVSFLLVVASLWFLCNYLATPIVTKEDGFLIGVGNDD